MNWSPSGSLTTCGSGLYCGVLRFMLASPCVINNWAVCGCFVQAQMAPPFYWHIQIRGWAAHPYFGGGHGLWGSPWCCISLPFLLMRQAQLPKIINNFNGRPNVNILCTISSESFGSISKGINFHKMSHLYLQIFHECPNYTLFILSSQMDSLQTHTSGFVM